MSAAQSPAQMPLGVQLRDTATLDNLVAGENAQAIATASALAGAAGANVYVWGGPGVGKSHLLQAVTRRAGERGRRCAYLPLADFRRQTPEVLDGLQSLDLLCLDEFDAIAGQRDWEEAFVGLFDQCRASGAAIVTAARRAPASLGCELPDLSSRLGWAAVYGLQELSDEAKARVLRQRAQQRGLQMPADVSGFLLRRSARDLATLIGVLDRLDKASLAAKRRLTVPFVKQVLEV